MPPLATSADAKAGFDLRPGNGDAATLALSGHLDAVTTAGLWRELDAQLPKTPTSSLEVDASGVDYCDGAGLALLHFLNMAGEVWFGSDNLVTIPAQ